MFDVAADASDAEWVKPEMSDQWMGMTDDEGESSKSENGDVEDGSLGDNPAPADLPADFESMDPVQADLRARIVNQRASLKKRVSHIADTRQKLQRCFGTSSTTLLWLTWSAQFCLMHCVCFNILSEQLSSL